MVPIAVLTLIIVGSTFSLIAWQPPILQTMLFGTSNSANGVTALASNPTGFYAAGYVGDYGNVTPSYVFVNSYGLDGRPIWSQHFGSPTNSEIFGMTVGKDGVYVTGDHLVPSPENESYARKYDLNGNLIWNRDFGNISSMAESISVGSLGVYVVGLGYGRYFLSAYSFDGSLMWTRLFSNGSATCCKIRVQAVSSTVYVVADESVGYQPYSIVRKYDGNGTILWTRGCACIPTGITTDSASIYAVGYVYRNTYYEDGFMVKYDFSGDQLWAAQFSGPGSTSTSRVEASADPSGIYLSETGDPSGMILKYDSNGNRVWSVALPWTLGRVATDLGLAISAAGPGVYVGGDFIHIGNNNAGTDAFVALLSRSSSLVFFGVNPPLSFGIVGLMATIVGVSIFFLWKRWRRMQRPRGQLGTVRSQRIPADHYSRI